MTPHQHDQGALTQRAWSGLPYLAAIGLLFGVLLQGWVIFAWWRGGGAHEITTHRDLAAASWKQARDFETMGLWIAAATAAYVAFSLWRNRRLTLFGMYCIGGASIAWLDMTCNALMPEFLYSTQFRNVQSLTAFYPWNRNIAAPSIAWPYLLLLPLYATQLPLLILAVHWLLRGVRALAPRLRADVLLLFGVTAGATINLITNSPLVRTGLWTFAAAPDNSRIFGVPWPQALSAGVMMGVTSAVMLHRNSNGLSVLERGMASWRPFRRTAVQLLAVIGMFQLLSFLIGVLIWIPTGLWSSPFPPMPPHLQADICDANGVTGTLYGPCPGSPAFRLPLPPNP